MAPLILLLVHLKATACSVKVSRFTTMKDALCQILVMHYQLSLSNQTPFTNIILRCLIEKCPPTTTLQLHQIWVLHILTPHMILTHRRVHICNQESAISIGACVLLFLANMFITKAAFPCYIVTISREACSLGFLLWGKSLGDLMRRSNLGWPPATL